MTTMIRNGLVVTMGHDCFFTLDVAEYLRYAYLVHKAHRANPGLIPPFQALDMELGNAARALGLGDRIGSLAVGKRADYNRTSRQPRARHSFLGAVVVKDGRMTTGDKVAVACVAGATKLWRRNGVAV
jgi:imidazolonepropionase-like amidohydrolase